MKLIIGLGNPGLKYRETRHNLGKLLVESIVRRQTVSFSKKSKLKASIASFSWESTPVIFAYPETYMNLSGQAVAALVRYYSVSIEDDLLIVMDDYAIPFGQIRLRPHGSPGGHNGLKSIDEALACQTYARLRLGIGQSSSESSGEPVNQFQALPLEKYVLERFSASEQNALPEIIARGAEACYQWLSEPMEQVMSTVNSSK